MVMELNIFQMFDNNNTKELKQEIKLLKQRIEVMEKQLKVDGWAMEILHEKLGINSDDFANMVHQRMKDSEIT